MYTTIGLAVEAGRKAINEQLGVGAACKQAICAAADAKTIASRISWGCAQALRGPGAANMTASQQREYSRGYKRGYLSAEGSGHGKERAGWCGWKTLDRRQHGLERWR